MIACGIDIGSTTIKAVVMRDGVVQGVESAPCGTSPSQTAIKVLDRALTKAGVGRGDVRRVVATGFGRNHCELADEVASEIRCHAAGVVSLFPEAHTVIEIGGQDSKVIRINGTGRVQEFLMNDRCAAGTGRFIETVARTLGVSVEETGAMAIAAETVCEINSMCTVFAETEIVGLLHKGESAGAILRGVFLSVARRTRGMVGRLALDGQLVFTGGVARNEGVVMAFREVLGGQVLVPEAPEFTGAHGAAILAAAG